MGEAGEGGGSAAVTDTAQRGRDRGCAHWMWVGVGRWVLQSQTPETKRK